MLDCLLKVHAACIFLAEEEVSKPHTPLGLNLYSRYQLASRPARLTSD